MNHDPINDIVDLLQRRGAAQYGQEAVSQLDHALQCAHLAERAGESDETVAAALLHDVGHLLRAEAPAPASGQERPDDLHQYTALPFLRPLFPDAVLEPIRLHVDAKRCLCHTDPGYFESLSPASVRSLALQGGVFSAEQAQAFRQQPHAEAALRLRRYDDQAKVPGRPTPDLAHFVHAMRRVARCPSPGQR